MAEGRFHRHRATARRRRHQGARTFFSRLRRECSCRYRRLLLLNDTPSDDWHSVAVCSDGSYGVEKGLISSFPVRVRGGKWEIVQGLPINDFSRAKIDASVAELKEEKSLG